MLDPKPKNSFTPKTWGDLNEELKYWFNVDTSKPSLIINTDNYEMSKDDIIQELEKKDYNVSQMSSGNQLHIS